MLGSPSGPIGGHLRPHDGCGDRSKRDRERESESERDRERENIRFAKGPNLMSIENDNTDHDDEMMIILIMMMR
jgi:hypothetical protein